MPFRSNTVPFRSNIVVHAARAGCRWLMVPALALAIGVGTSAAPALAAPARATTARAVTLAAHYKGVPYVWGGTTTRGFDCSGYVQFVYRKLGVTLPRTAEEQWEQVRHITRDQLTPGDLVFWGRPYGVYHVGIYAGHDKIWNAPHTGARVHLETIWGGAKLYGRVRGLPSIAEPVGTSGPAPGLGPLGASWSGAPLTLAPVALAPSPAATAPAAPTPAAPTPTAPTPTAPPAPPNSATAASTQAAPTPPGNATPAPVSPAPVATSVPSGTS